MNYKNKSIFQSFQVAANGVSEAFRGQKNLRVHLLLSVIAAGLGIYFNLDSVEWGLLWTAVFAVVICELLNTAIEAVVDMVTAEFHPLAKIAKDVAAGAVLLSAFFSLIIAYLLFLHRFVTLFCGGF